MIFQIFPVYISAELERLSLVLVGCLARRYNKLNGPIVLSIVNFLILVALPAKNIVNLYGLDISLILSSFTILLPLWGYKIAISGLVYLVFQFLVTFPEYFRWTFVALLVTDSNFNRTSKLRQGLCELIIDKKTGADFKPPLNINCSENDQV